MGHAEIVREAVAETVRQGRAGLGDRHAGEGGRPQEFRIGFRSRLGGELREERLAAAPDLQTFDRAHAAVVRGGRVDIALAQMAQSVHRRIVEDFDRSVFQVLRIRQSQFREDSVRNAALGLLFMDGQDRDAGHFRAGPAGRGDRRDGVPRGIRVVLKQDGFIFIRILRHQGNGFRRVHRRTAADADEEVGALADGDVSGFHDRLDGRVLFDLVIDEVRDVLRVQRRGDVRFRAVVLGGPATGHQHRLRPEGGQFGGMGCHAVFLFEDPCRHVKRHVMPHFPRPSLRRAVFPALPGTGARSPAR